MKDVYITAAATLIAARPQSVQSVRVSDMQRIFNVAVELEKLFENGGADVPDEVEVISK